MGSSPNELGLGVKRETLRDLGSTTHRWPYSYKGYYNTLSFTFAILDQGVAVEARFAVLAARTHGVVEAA